MGWFGLEVASCAYWEIYQSIACMCVYADVRARVRMGRATEEAAVQPQDSFLPEN